MAFKDKDKRRDETSLNVRRSNLEAYARRSDAIGRGRDHWGRFGLATRVEFDAFLLQRERHPEDIPFATGQVQGPPVVAFINDNRWMARCECGGLAVVDPDDGGFYCHGCFNMANGGVPIGKDMHGGYPRPVIFPAEKDRERLEAVLLTSDDPLWRNWTPIEADSSEPGASRDNRALTPAEIQATILSLEDSGKTADPPQAMGEVTDAGLLG